MLYAEHECSEWHEKKFVIFVPFVEVYAAKQAPGTLSEIQVPPKFRPDNAMLPDPKKVAQSINKLFQSAEEKRQRAEAERSVQIRMGKTRIQRHIARQQKMAARLKSLAKRALAINDEARFRQVGRQLLWTQNDIRRWQQYLLSLEIMEARRDQVKASAELMKAIQAMTESLNAMKCPRPPPICSARSSRGLRGLPPSRSAWR